MSSNIVFFCCLFFLLTQTYAQQSDPLASEQQQQGIEGDDVADDETAAVKEDDGGDVVVDKKSGTTPRVTTTTRTGHFKVMATATTPGQRRSTRSATATTPRRPRYVVVTRNENWWGAQRTCQNMGGDLVVIDNENEHYVVTNLLPSKKDTRWNKVCRRHHWHLPGMSFWTAGQRQNTHEKYSAFVWKTHWGNRPMYYSRWNRGEPNNFDGVESCMQLSRAYGYNWNDARCDVGFCFICEF